MTENLSSLTISPFIHDSPNRRPVRSAVHNPPMMGKRIIFIFILFSEVEEEDGGRDDQHEKEGRRRVENIAGSKKKKEGRVGGSGGIGALLSSLWLVHPSCLFHPGPRPASFAVQTCLRVPLSLLALHRTGKTSEKMLDRRQFGNGVGA